MCAQEVMNIEEQCAEHFLLQNDRSADQIQNIFGLRVKLLQNKFKICVMGKTVNSQINPKTPMTSFVTSFVQKVKKKNSHKLHL